MHRYITVWFTGFSLSAISARYWPFLPGKLWIVLTACIVIIIHIAAYRDNVDKHRVRLIKKKYRVANWYGQTGKPFTAVSFMISGMMSGMIWMASVGHWYLAWQLPQSKIQQDVIVSGQITHSRQIGDDQQLILNVGEIDNQTVFPSPAVLLFVESAIGQFQLHQHVALRVSLKPVSGSLNPGSDRRSWYVSRAIIASGTVQPSALNRVISPADSFHHYASARSRQAGYSPWLVALLTGDRSGLKQTDWQLMRETGTGHLFSISGLHVGMIALWGSWLTGGVCGLLFWMSGRQHNRRNVRYVTITFTVLFTAMYATLANWQVPVARAWLLVLLLGGLFFSGANWTWPQRYVVMLVACIVLFPFSLFGSSFYLSAGALALLIFTASRIATTVKDVHNRVTVLLQTQFVLSLLLIPITAGFFDAASVLTAPVNLIAIPAVTFIVPVGMAGLLINYFTLQPNLLLDAADGMLDMLIGLLEMLQPWMISFSELTIPSVAFFSLLCAMLLWLLPPFRYRIFCLVILTLPVFLAFLRPNPAHWIVHVFDVGQGTAMAISQGDRAVLIDTGPSFEQGNALRSIVIPTLRHLNIRAVDGVIITHGDDDHAGGRADVGLLPQTKSRGEEPGKYQGFLYDNFGGCQRGNHWQWQQLQFSVRWPVQGNARDGNTHSCVLRVSGANHALLIAGDIPLSSEYTLLYLLAADPALPLNADVLIAPHHGSETSSSAAFVQVVQPAVTVFTTGAFHRWALPAQAVRHRYQNVGSQLLDTGRHGYLRMTITDSEIVTERYNRELSQRWFDNRLYQHD